MISCEGVDLIDTQGSEKIGELLELARTYGAEIRLARVELAVLDVLRRDDVVDRLGEHRIFGNVHEACAGHIPEPPGG